MTGSLPQDAAARKAAPMAEGLLWYFPNALAAVAAVSKAGNDQHNPGEPMHHARGKSMDHADCIIRHLADAGTVDTDGQRHTAKVAWRALALLQEEIEREEGVPLPRNARHDIPNAGKAMPDTGRNRLIAFDRNGPRAPTPEEIEEWRAPLSAETLRAYGIGDAEPATHVADPLHLSATTATSQHPMHAEALRDHDERISGPEDRL